MDRLLRKLAPHLEEVTEYNGYLTARCPFHSDRSPSFFVYPDFYICKSPHCGKQGSPERLLSDLNGTIRHNIPKQQKERARNPFNSLQRKVGNGLGQGLKHSHKSVDKARSYLYTRGVTDRTIHRMGIGLYEGWITIPVRSLKTDRITGAIARSIDHSVIPKYFVPFGQDPNLLFSWNPSENFHNQNSVFLTFGIFSALPLYKMGLCTLSSLCGTQLNPKALQSIRKTIYIIGDYKEEYAAKKLASKLDWRGKALRINYPEGCYDLGDIYEKYGDCSWIESALANLLEDFYLPERKTT